MKLMIGRFLIAKFVIAKFIIANFVIKKIRNFIITNLHSQKLSLCVDQANRRPSSVLTRATEEYCSAPLCTAEHITPCYPGQQKHFGRIFSAHSTLTRTTEDLTCLQSRRRKPSFRSNVEFRGMDKSIHTSSIYEKSY